MQEMQVELMEMSWLGTDEQLWEQLVGGAVPPATLVTKWGGELVESPRRGIFILPVEVVQQSGVWSRVSYCTPYLVLLRAYSFIFVPISPCKTSSGVINTRSAFIHCECVIANSKGQY